jgi:N-acetylmuramoyl-L-alanine amidase
MKRGMLTTLRDQEGPTRLDRSPGRRCRFTEWSVLVSVGFALLALVGCVEPQSGIEQLPEPPTRTLIRERPSAPPPPPEKPVAPPPAPAMKAMRGATIIVDPGHGGRDPGAKGVSALPEKTINYRIAMELAKQLQARGAHVAATRNSDEFIALDDRAAAAESTRADLFISIHSDSHRSTDMAGATIYVSRGASTSSVRAAESIAAALQAAGIHCRGIRDAGYRVLQGHSRPGVLVECGYLTNPTEAQYLNSAAYQTRLASAIAAGVASYFGS